MLGWDPAPEVRGHAGIRRQEHPAAVQYELLWMQQHCHRHPARGDQDSTGTPDHSPAGWGGRAGGIPRSIPPPVALRVVGVPGSPPLLQSPAWAAPGLRSCLAPLQRSSPTL